MKKYFFLLLMLAYQLTYAQPQDTIRDQELFLAHILDEVDFGKYEGDRFKERGYEFVSLPFFNSELTDDNLINHGKMRGILATLYSMTAKDKLEYEKLVDYTDSFLG